MKVLINTDVEFTDGDYIDGIEFEIINDRVWITIGDKWVAVNKKELVKILKLVE